MKFYKQKTEIQKAITLNGKKNFYRTPIVFFAMLFPTFNNSTTKQFNNKETKSPQPRQ